MKKSYLIVLILLCLTLFFIIYQNNYYQSIILKMEEYIAELKESMQIDKKTIISLKNEIEDTKEINIEKERQKNELFSWLTNKKYDKVILENISGDQIDITENKNFKNVEKYFTNENFIKIINAYSPSGPTYAIGYENVYKFIFYNDNEEYEIKVNPKFILYNGIWYDNYELYYFAKTAMPCFSYKGDVNSVELLYILYNSEFLRNDTTRMQNMAGFISKHMKPIEKLPNDDKLVPCPYNDTLIGYLYGDIIQVNIYDYDKYSGMYIEIKYKDKIQIFEQLDNLSSVDNIDGNSVYKYLGAG